MSGALMTAAERADHPLNYILQKCCSCQCPSVGISCYGQSFLTGVLLNIHEPIISGTVPGIEFSLGVKPRDAGWAPSWFLPQQCGKQLLPEAFFDRVQDFLANTCLCLLVTEYLP